MKFLNVYCEDRKKEVYINLDKIVLITRLSDDSCQVELEGRIDTAVRVAMAAEELIRKVNGEERTGIGFRTGR